MSRRIPRHGRTSGCQQAGPEDLPGFPQRVEHDDQRGQRIRPPQPGGRSARRWRSSPVPDSSQSTTTLAPISISESSPNPASATDRALMAATASTAMPTTFHPSGMPSNTRPQRSSAVAARSQGLGPAVPVQGAAPAGARASRFASAHNFANRSIFSCPGQAAAERRRSPAFRAAAAR